jgi:hypothetical protein
MKASVLVCAALLGALGCHKSAPSGPLSYVLRVKDLSLVGTSIVVGGKRATFARERYDAGVDVARADVELARDTPPVLGALGVSLDTPCGPATIGLTSDISVDKEVAWRAAGGPIQTMLALAKPIPPSRHVWVDAAPGAVTLGKATLVPGRNVIFDLACAGTPPQIAIAGEPAGVVPASDEQPSSVGPSALFITGAPQTCYRYGLVVYAKAGDGGSARILSGAPLYVLSGPEVDYFLTAAPSQSSAERNAFELVKVPCK